MMRRNGQKMAIRIIEIPERESARRVTRAHVNKETEYTRSLKKQVEQREKELLLAEKGKPNVKHLIVNEVYQRIKYSGGITIFRAIRELNMSQEAILNIAKLLKRKKLIKIRHNRRGVHVFEIT